MKKIIGVLMVVILLSVSVYFVPRLIHKCDDCEKVFVGTGYEPNAILELVSDENETICKSCAEKQHVIEITLGKNLEDYKKSLFD